MSLRDSAEEHLRVLRALAERSTSYTAVSAPTALFGSLALAVALVFLLFPAASPRLFVAVWILTLAVVAAFNAILLKRDAERRGDLFVSPGMRTGLRTLLPAWLVAGFLTSGSFIFGQPALQWLIPLWISHYAVGLLATSPFAPPSIVRLGWAFLAAGLISCLFAATRTFDNPDALRIASIEMATTFGALHLVYGFITLHGGNSSRAPRF